LREHPGLKLYLGSRLIGLEGFAGAKRGGEELKRLFARRESP